ncbi:MAG: DNA-directed RNA polymerase subunit K [Candidatus Kariarchaeaceae archaeon]
MLSGANIELTSDDDTVLIGESVLTRYERARIVGARALQISQGAPILIDVDPDDFQPVDVATSELKARVLPVGLQRWNQNKEFQLIPVQWLKDREFISQIQLDDSE